MKTLQIEIPKNHKIDSLDHSTGVVKFVELNRREKIKNWQDILDFHKMTQAEFDKWCDRMRPHEIGQREEEMIVACYNNRQLTDPLPTWGPDTPLKRYPLFKMPSSGSSFAFIVDVDCRSYSSVGARLCFFGEESYEDIIDAVNKFLPQYERSRTL